MVQDSPEQMRWRYAFSKMMEDAPESFQARQEQYVKMSDVFHEELALHLGRSLNAHLKSIPESSVTQVLADDLAKKLSQLHLAPRCPNSGRPARLVIDPAGPEKTHRGKIDFVVQDEAGQSHRTHSQRSLPTIELMLDDPSQSPPLAARFRKRSGPGNQR